MFKNVFKSRDNVARQTAGDSVMRRVDSACWVTKDTDTLHSSNGYSNASHFDVILRRHLLI